MSGREGPAASRGSLGSQLGRLLPSLGLPAALLLATVALGVLSAQAVSSESRERRRLVSDKYRSVADVVSSHLDTAILASDRALAAAAEGSGAGAEALMTKLEELEASRPELEPLAIVFPRTPETLPSGHLTRPVDHDAGPSKRYKASIERAAGAEHISHRFDEAAAAYSEAVAAADVARERAVALNALARAEGKAGNLRRAAALYKRLGAEAEALEPESARFVLIARQQTASSYQRLGQSQDFTAAVIDLYKALLTLRFVVGDDTYQFYKGRLDELLANARLSMDAAQQIVLERLQGRERALDRVGQALAFELLPLNGADGEGPPVVRYFAAGSREDPSVVAMVALGDSAAQVAHVWRQADLEALLQRSNVEAGPSGIGVTLQRVGARSSSASAARAPADAIAATAPIARAPHWRVAAFPQSGSLDAAASRDVVRFAVMLALVFGVVVAAMVLAARSVRRELALSRARSEFVASVSHELKTPLSLIRMCAEMLREGWVAEGKRVSYYENIVRESERLSGLIDNVLAFSSIESGTRTYQLRTADLREIVAGLLARYRYHLKAANIDLVEELPSEPLYARVDGAAIEQVLVNLLSNAVKYMGKSKDRPRRVRLSLTRAGEQANISVADTGIGMSESDRARIFERYWRADNEDVRDVAGSGLGLTLVRHIVEAHDGAISVDSAPGQGTTFAVTLRAVTGAAL